MGYRIRYQMKAFGGKKQCQSGRFTFLKWISIVTCSVIAFGILSRARLYRCFLPGDPVVTEQALYGFISDIRKGNSLPDSVTVFCRYILDNA